MDGWKMSCWRWLSLYGEYAPKKRVRCRLQRSTQGVSDDDEMARRAGSRLAGSYVNFYICNGGIVMPGWGDAEADARCAELTSGTGCLLAGTWACSPSTRWTVCHASRHLFPLHPHPLQGQGGLGGVVPRAQGRAAHDAGGAAGRRQRPLHHAATAGGSASPAAGRLVKPTLGAKEYRALHTYFGSPRQHVVLVVKKVVKINKAKCIPFNGRSTM